MSAAFRVTKYSSPSVAIGGSGLFPKRDRLYLQFRKGRLAGWKGDWGHNWMWQ